MSTPGTVPPWEFTQEGSFAAPFTVPIPASLEVQPYTATATFDCSGASGPVAPTITIIGPGGEKLARVQPVVNIAQGDTKGVTWLPPFGAAASSPAATGSGLQYGGTNPPTYGPDNSGDWLQVTTTDASASDSGNGIYLNDSAPNSTTAGVTIASGNTGSGQWGFVDVEVYGAGNAGFLVQTHGAGNAGCGLVALDANNSGVLLSSCANTNSGGGIAVGALASNGEKIGFFGVPTAAQPAHPVTLADVIAALTTLGLTA